MKKTLITILLVLLTLTMFVACKDEPSEECNYVAEVKVIPYDYSVNGDDHYYTLLQGTYYLKGGDDNEGYDEEDDKYRNYNYALYSDKACTKPVYFDYGKTQYGFQLNIKSNYVYYVCLGDEDLVDYYKFGNCGVIDDASDFLDNDGNPVDKMKIVHFNAGDWLTFHNSTISESNGEIKVTFVKDADIVCYSYN